MEQEAHMTDKKDACRILVKNLKRRRRRLEDNIKMHFKKTKCEIVWMLTKHKNIVQQWTLFNKILTNL
jgi:hypothetical protein